MEMNETRLINPLRTINVCYEVRDQDLRAQLRFLRGGDDTHTQDIINDYFSKPIVILFDKMTLQERAFVLQGFVGNIITAKSYNEEWEQRNT